VPTDIDIGHHALARVQDIWNAAARAWDVAALTALYTPDALLFGGRPGHAVGGREIEAYFASYRGTIHSASLDLTDQRVLALGSAQFLAQGQGHFAFELKDGRSTRSVLRTTLLIAGPEPWKIRAQHFSPTPEAPPLGR